MNNQVLFQLCRRSTTSGIDSPFKVFQSSIFVILICMIANMVFSQNRNIPTPMDEFGPEIGVDPYGGDIRFWKAPIVVDKNEEVIPGSVIKSK